MNKVIIIVIGVVIILGAIFAFKNFYNPPVVLELTPTPQQLPTSQGTIPPAQVKLPPIPTTSSSALDRIEAAIRAKLKK